MKADAMSKEARALQKQLHEFPFLWGITQSWKPGRETVIIKTVKNEDDWNRLVELSPSRAFMVFTSADGEVCLGEIIDDDLWVAATRIHAADPETTFHYVVMVWVDKPFGSPLNRFFIFRPSRGKSIRYLPKIQPE